MNTIKDLFQCRFWPSLAANSIIALHVAGFLNIYCSSSSSSTTEAAAAAVRIDLICGIHHEKQQQLTNRLTFFWLVLSSDVLGF
jgi:hypothetical protein